MDREQFILSTIRPMGEFTFPFLTSVVGIKDSQSGEHVGSGVRCVIHGRKALVTALHVIEEAMNYPGKFAISRGYGATPYQVDGVIQYDRAGDLAVYYLPDGFTDAASEARFWPEDRVDKSLDRLATDFLFVHGFPAARSRFVRAFQGVVSKSLPYGAMERIADLPTDLQPYQFAVDFDPSSMKLDTGAGDPFIDPHGLSGGGVWRIGLSGGTAAGWKPQLSWLVGIVTQWRPDQKILIASKAERLGKPTI